MRAEKLSEARKVLHAAEAHLEQARTYTASMTKMYKRLHKLFAKAAYMASENGEIIRSSDKAWGEFRKNESASQSKSNVKFAVREDFHEKLNEWFKNTTEEERRSSGGKILVGTTTDALRDIGVEDYNIYVGKAKLQNILDKHSEMSLELIEKAINILEDPTLILGSKTVDDAIVLFGEARAAGKKPVMLSVLLKPKSKRGEILDYAVATSAYGRNVRNVQYLIDNSPIYYIGENKERADSWLSALGLQLPSATTNYGPQSPLYSNSEKSQPLSDKNSKKYQQREKSEETLRVEAAETILRDKYNVNVGKLLEGMDSTLENYMGSKSRKELDADILEAAVKTNEFSSGEGSFKYMRDSIESLTDEIIAGSPVLTTEIADDNAVEAQKAIKEMRFKVSDMIKADFESAKDYESFRKQHIGEAEASIFIEKCIIVQNRASAAAGINRSYTSFLYFSRNTIDKSNKICNNIAMR